MTRIWFADIGSSFFYFVYIKPYTTPNLQSKMKIFKCLAIILMSSIFNISSAASTQPRWIANRSLETWKLYTSQTYIVINGILDMDSRQVDTSINQETFTDNTAGGYREWEVHPGQILEIIYQLNAPVSKFWSESYVGEPLRLKDKNNIFVYYDWQVLFYDSERVGATILLTWDKDEEDDMIRFNYPSEGDVVIWGDIHESINDYKQTERWIKNRSSEIWKFYGNPSSIIIDGFIDPAYSKVDYTIPSQYTGTTSDGYRAWKIHPGQTLQIVYRIEDADTNGVLAIKDHVGHLEVRRWSVDYERRWYTIGLYRHIIGPQIELDEHQDPVNLNHPNDGEIDMYGDQWL